MVVNFLSERAGRALARERLVLVGEPAQRCWRVESGAKTEWAK
jgi:hypothetical protein